jgi:hypothetical protein
VHATLEAASASWVDTFTVTINDTIAEWSIAKPRAKGENEEV